MEGNGSLSLLGSPMPKRVAHQAQQVTAHLHQEAREEVIEDVENLDDVAPVGSPGLQATGGLFNLQPFCLLC